MTEQFIQDALDKLFGNYEYRLQNQYIFQDNRESDWFGISTSGYAPACGIMRPIVFTMRTRSES